MMFWVNFSTVNIHKEAIHEKHFKKLNSFKQQEKNDIKVKLL